MGPKTILWGQAPGGFARDGSHRSSVDGAQGVLGRTHLEGALHIQDE